MFRLPYTGQRYAPYVRGYCFRAIEGNELVYWSENQYTELYKTMPGQITRTSPFGIHLYELARSGPKHWVEIGTWNGLGTTKCILDGFAERLHESPKLASVEIDPVLFDAAAHNLMHHPARSCVDFYQGKLMPSSMIQAKPFPTPDDLGEQEQQNAHFFIHYDRERALYETTIPFCPPFSPEVAVLDGGEYSGYLDWLHLDKSNLKYLCLDDTNVTKNRKVISELGSEWKCIASGNDRCGWAIYVRVA